LCWLVGVGDRRLGRDDAYGDAVSQREDAEALAVEGCLAGFEFGGGVGSGCS
jgi:hypothetical protein